MKMCTNNIHCSLFVFYILLEKGIRTIHQDVKFFASNVTWSQAVSLCDVNGHLTYVTPKNIEPVKLLKKAAGIQHGSKAWIRNHNDTQDTCGYISYYQPNIQYGNCNQMFSYICSIEETVTDPGSHSISGVVVIISIVGCLILGVAAVLVVLRYRQGSWSDVIKCVTRQKKTHPSESKSEHAGHRAHDSTGYQPNTAHGPRYPVSNAVYSVSKDNIHEMECDDHLYFTVDSVGGQSPNRPEMFSEQGIVKTDTYSDINDINGFSRDVTDTEYDNRMESHYSTVEHHEREYIVDEDSEDMSHDTEDMPDDTEDMAYSIINHASRKSVNAYSHMVHGNGPMVELESSYDTIERNVSLRHVFEGSSDHVYNVSMRSDRAEESEYNTTLKRDTAWTHDGDSTYNTTLHRDASYTTTLKRY